MTPYFLLDAALLPHCFVSGQDFSRAD